MFREALQKSVIPAKAGIQDFKCRDKSTSDWIPAFAGMTPAGLLQSLPRNTRKFSALKANTFKENPSVSSLNGVCSWNETISNFDVNRG